MVFLEVINLMINHPEVFGLGRLTDSGRATQPVTFGSGSCSKYGSTEDGDMSGCREIQSFSMASYSEHVQICENWNSNLFLRKWGIFLRIVLIMKCTFILLSLLLQSNLLSESIWYLSQTLKPFMTRITNKYLINCIY